MAAGRDKDEEDEDNEAWLSPPPAPPPEVTPARASTREYPISGCAALMGRYFGGAPECGWAIDVSATDNDEEEEEDDNDDEDEEDDNEAALESR